MDYGWLVPLLALCTLLAVSVFALISKESTERRRHDPTVPKSTLAKDGPQGGVDMLTPPDERPRDKPHVAPVLD